MIGGHAPTASSAETNENGWPARKSDVPEHVNPISSLGMPASSITSWTTGMRISTSFRVRSIFSCGATATATIATSLMSAIPDSGRKYAIDSVVGPHSSFGFHTASTRIPMWIWS